MKIQIPVSIGELLDKITILQIKSEKTSNKYVSKELESLINIAKRNNVYLENFTQIGNLKRVNQELWEVESELRRLEASDNFCPRFIELARSVYKLNDERFSIKKKINEHYNSEYQEVKIY